MTDGRLEPFSLNTVLSPVFTVSSTVSRALRSVSAANPAHVFASATDGSIKLLDISTFPPTEVHSVNGPGIAPSKKVPDKIAVLATVDRLLVLAEGSLTFHALPSFDVASAGSAGGIGLTSNVVKGVLAFVVDDWNMARDSVQIAIIKRKGVALFRVTRGTVDLLRELTCKNSLITASLLRNGRLCYSDAFQYYTIDLNAGDLLTLLPISQDIPQPALEGEQITLNPDQRPAIASVGNKEFIIASHTGDTSLGFFLTADTGEPCRGTIEWASNVRSIVIDQEFVIALLNNRTIEIHKLETQTLVQVIQLPESIPDPRSILSLYPRTLTVQSSLNSDFAVCLPTTFPLYKEELPKVGSDSETPSTPPSDRLEEPLLEPSRIAIDVRFLLISRNSITALQPLATLQKVEHYIRRGYLRKAIAQVANLSTASYDNRAFIAYVNLKVGLKYFFETQFQEAGACFAVGCANGCDPRLVINLFPEYRLQEWSVRKVEAQTWLGLQGLLQLGNRGIQNIIMDNLYKNYSPQIRPEIESQNLNATLLAGGKEMIKAFLAGWTETEERTDRENRHIRRAVDTALAKLAAEEGADDDCLEYIRMGTVAIRDLVDYLEVKHYNGLLSKVYARTDQHERLLALWIRLYDTADSLASIEQISALISSFASGPLKRSRALWLLQREFESAIEILSVLLETASLEDFYRLYEEVQAIDTNGAFRIMQFYAFYWDHKNVALSNKLFTAYIDQLKVALKHTDYKPHWLARDFGSDRMPLPERLMRCLEDGDILQRVADLRLRLILFLHTDTSLDVASLRSTLESMPDLVYERAMVYGKLKLYRQALATLVINGLDVHSAEIACLQQGNPLSESMARQTALRLKLPTNRLRTDEANLTENAPNLSDLMRLLIDILLANSSSNNAPSLLRFVNAQAVHLDLAETLERLPASAAVQDIQPFLERGLRRSCHNKYEAMIMKFIASYKFQTVDDELYDLQREMGGVVAEEDGSENDEEGRLVTSKKEKSVEIMLDKALEPEKGTVNPAVGNVIELR